MNKEELIKIYDNNMKLWSDNIEKEGFENNAFYYLGYARAIRDCIEKL